MNMYHVLGQHAFWNVNKKLVRAIGINATLLLSDLISKRQYFIEHGDIQEGGWFFNTQKNIELDTTLSRREQDTAIKLLVEKKIMEVDVRGLPARKFFKINDSVIAEILQFSLTENAKLECAKPPSNKNKEIKINSTTTTTNADAVFEDFLEKANSIHKAHAKQFWNTEKTLLKNSIAHSTGKDYCKADFGKFNSFLVSEHKLHEEFSEYVKHFRNWLSVRK